jgi:RNA polymerase sigma-70 factor (ECF subfamily)
VKLEPTYEAQDFVQVQQALHALPAKLRAVAILALVEETPYAEIAEATGLSVSAVKSRVFRAVRMLRKKLTRLGIRQ